MDIGSGSGDLLLNMKIDGFSNLHGVDPFLRKDNIYSNEITVRKIDIYEIEENYDLIMFNHSFEHMPNPLTVLQKANALLYKNKYFIKLTL